MRKRNGKGWWTDGIETIDGKSMTRGEWCEHYGLSIQLVRDRVNKRGWDFETAVKRKPLGQEWDGKFETIGGITKTRGEWIEEYGADKSRVYMRMRHGETFKDALNPVNRITAKGEEVSPEEEFRQWCAYYTGIDGTYRSRKEWCELAGEDPREVKERMGMHVTFGEALTGLIGNEAVFSFLKATVGGETLTIAEHIKKRGVNPRMVMTRLGKGYKPEIALMSEKEFYDYRQEMRREARAKAAIGEKPDVYNDYSALDNEQLIDFCLHCEKPRKKCRGDVIKCVRDKLIIDRLKTADEMTKKGSIECTH